MSATAPLHSSISKLLHWLQYDALPFWSQHGIRPEDGAVYEQLLFNGQPDLNVNQRLRVQARQIMVFCAAQQQHWLADSQHLVGKIQSFMRQYARIDGHQTGYVQWLSPQNQIVDPKLDTYDFAFYLLACFYRLDTFKDQAALNEARQLLQYLDEQFKSTSAGWLEGNYPAPHRRQNPHMHLFEAFMTGYEVTADGMWLAKAGQIFSLFEQYFFDPTHHILHEYFDEDWQPVHDLAAKTIEPGHMFEWVWLLRWYEKLTATPVSHYCDALYQKALAIGFDPTSHLIYDAVDVKGQPRDSGKRCWPLTELVKASLAQAKQSEQPQRLYYEQKASFGIAQLFDFYMHPTIPGSYIDQIGANNQVIADHAPASTLYHFVVMGIETLDYQRHFLTKQQR